MSDDNVIPLKPPGDEGLLQLPECPVQNCDHCGKHLSEGANWIQKGYGCSLCRTNDPHVWIRDNARLREVIEATALHLANRSHIMGNAELAEQLGAALSEGTGEVEK